MATRGSFGSYVPSTNIWDVSILYSVEVNSPEFKELLVRLYQNLNLMANVLNTKDSGYYDNSMNDFVTSKQWFPNPALSSTSAITPTFRVAQRAVINFGALPNTATKSVAHGITVNSSTTWTRIEATATDTTGLTGVPIPYSSVTAPADNIEIYVDATNVNIITGTNRTNYNVTYVILEYLIS